MSNIRLIDRGLSGLGRVTQSGARRRYAMVSQSPNVRTGPTILPTYGPAPGYRETNTYDMQLGDEKAVYDAFFAEGMEPIKNGSPDFPWVNMPPQGQRIRKIGTISAATVPFTNVDTTVLTFYVPVGFDGIIDTVVCNILPGGGPTGFIEGSGTITWRLSANLRYLRDMGNIQFSLGNLQLNTTPDSGSGLRIYSGDLITFTVAFSAGGAGIISPAANVVCACMGWVYPR